MVLNLGLHTFLKRYAQGYKSGEGAFARAVEFEEGNWEWQRMLLPNVRGKQPIALLCCPEDHLKCRVPHAAHIVCQNCQILVCYECAPVMQRSRGSFVAPMALCNDNFWGFTTVLLARYKVRWIEMAAILPCWTNMIVYYVEEDYGHVMTEVVAKQQYRTVCRGYCFSFHLPWEDVLRDLSKNISDADLQALPRDPECIKYLLRLHLRVAGKDFHEHLRQVHVRPFVLIRLLHELIDRGHEVFRGKGSPEVLRQRVKRAVEER